MGKRSGGAVCAAVGCNNKQAKQRDLSFFRFPRDNERCYKWLTNCGRTELLQRSTDSLYASFKLCADHFEDDQFMNSNIRKSLVWYAIPTVFPKNDATYPKVILIEPGTLNAPQGTDANEPQPKLEPKSTDEHDANDANQPQITDQASTLQQLQPLASYKEFPSLVMKKKIGVQRRLRREFSEKYRKNLKKPWTEKEAIRPQPNPSVDNDNELHVNLENFDFEADHRQRFPQYYENLENIGAHESVQSTTIIVESSDQPPVVQQDIPAAVQTESSTAVQVENSPVAQTQIPTVVYEVHTQSPTSTAVPNKSSPVVVQSKSPTTIVQSKIPTTIVQSKIPTTIVHAKSPTTVVHRKTPRSIQTKIRPAAAKTKRPVRKTYQCKECGRYVTGEKAMDRHMATHAVKEPKQCDICGKFFTWVSDLAVHKRFHQGEKPFKCDECGKGFSQACDLARHKKIHTNDKRHACDVCGKMFLQVSDVNVHKKTHTGEKPYKCPICNKCFGHSSHLSRHKRTHTGERPYKCINCGTCFTQNGHMTGHMKKCLKGLLLSKDRKTEKTQHTGTSTHEKNPLESTLGKDSQVPKPKKTQEKHLKCPMCEKHFSQRCRMKAHMRSHTGEKPFNCNACGKGFNNSSNLKKHQKKHPEKIIKIKQNSQKRVHEDNSQNSQVSIKKKYENSLVIVSVERKFPNSQVFPVQKNSQNPEVAVEKNCQDQQVSVEKNSENQHVSKKENEEKPSQSSEVSINIVLDHVDEQHKNQSSLLDLSVNMVKKDPETS